MPTILPPAFCALSRATASRRKAALADACQRWAASLRRVWVSECGVFHRWVSRLDAGYTAGVRRKRTGDKIAGATRSYGHSRKAAYQLPFLG
jgi:hypothetical protein